MKLFKLITLLSLVGCGGPEFSGTAQKFNPEAGAAGQGESGEGGENSSAGLNSGGSTSFAGSESGGTSNDTAGSAGKDTGGSETAGTSNGGVGGSTAGNTTGGSSIGGSAGNNSAGMAGTGGSGFNPCMLSDKTFACENVTWDWASQAGGEIDMHTPAKYAWECPTITDTPPAELKSNFSGGNARQCTASKFGAPNTLWCCTSN